MQLETKPRRLSPVHNRHQALGATLDFQTGWLIPRVYSTAVEETVALRENIGLVDISAMGKLTLKGIKADGIVTARLGTTPTIHGDAIEDKSSQILVAKLTPDEFLILTLPGREKELAASLEAEIESHNAFVSVVDQTSGLVGLLISGPKSIGVMSKLCTLDFSPTNFPNLHAAQSSFAKVRATIVRHDRGDLPSFELYADRSYADYLWTTILDAGNEFGIQPVGWEAVGLAISK